MNNGTRVVAVGMVTRVEQRTSSRSLSRFNSTTWVVTKVSARGVFVSGVEDPTESRRFLPSEAKRLVFVSP